MSDATAVCSRAGCRDTAAWAILWRNPRIHTPDRRKTWVACDAHVGYLREFLAARDFPLEVRGLSSDTEAAPTGPALTGTAPTGPAFTGSAPTGPAPTGPAPVAPSPAGTTS